MNIISIYFIPCVLIHLRKICSIELRVLVILKKLLRMGFCFVSFEIPANWLLFEFCNFWTFQRNQNIILLVKFTLVFTLANKTTKKNFANSKIQNTREIMTEKITYMDLQRVFQHHHSVIWRDFQNFGFKMLQ